MGDENLKTTGRLGEKKKNRLFGKKKCHKENGNQFRSYKLDDRSAQGRRPRVHDIKKTEK
jgi:hypothetical protein